jgi:hypothetical protein
MVARRGSKVVPSTSIRCRTTASLRASATIARQQAARSDGEAAAVC